MAPLRAFQLSPYEIIVERVDDLRTELKADIAQLDRRVMRLDVAR